LNILGIDIGYSNLKLAFGAKAFRRATVHWLRHTCGAHLASSGVPVNLVQKLLGHASLATTSIYTATDDEGLWAEIESRV
jgi:site-specific recombinase XerD